MTRDDLRSLPSGILALAGVWLIASPWLVATSPALDAAVWNCVIAGILIALIGGSELWGAAKSPTLGALNGVLGVWIAASPFVLGYSSDRPWTWSSVVTGVVVFGFALTGVTTREVARREAESGGVAHGRWVGGRYNPGLAFEHEDHPLWLMRRGEGSRAGGAWEGEFRGIGPKGWQRSDDDIKADVCSGMADHPRLDASEIDVVVLNGEVTLLGSVPNRGARRLAEDLADSVSGVRDVENELRVQRGIRRVA